MKSSKKSCPPQVCCLRCHLHNFEPHKSNLWAALASFWKDLMLILTSFFILPWQTKRVAKLHGHSLNLIIQRGGDCSFSSVPKLVGMIITVPIPGSEVHSLVLSFNNFSGNNENEFNFIWCKLGPLISFRKELAFRGLFLIREHSSENADSTFIRTFNHVWICVRFRLCSGWEPMKFMAHTVSARVKFSS